MEAGCAQQAVHVGKAFALFRQRLGKDDIHIVRMGAKLCKQVCAECRRFIPVAYYNILPAAVKRPRLLRSKNNAAFSPLRAYIIRPGNAGSAPSATSTSASGA